MLTKRLKILTADKTFKTKDEALWEYEDGAGVKRQGYFIKSSEGQGSDITYFFKRKDGGNTDIVSGSRLKNARVVSRDSKTKDATYTGKLIDTGTYKGIIYFITKNATWFIFQIDFPNGEQIKLPAESKSDAKNQLMFRIDRWLSNNPKYRPKDGYVGKTKDSTETIKLDKNCSAIWDSTFKSLEVYDDTKDVLIKRIGSNVTSKDDAVQKAKRIVDNYVKSNASAAPLSKEQKLNRAGMYRDSKTKDAYRSQVIKKRLRYPAKG